MPRWLTYSHDFDRGAPRPASAGPSPARAQRSKPGQQRRPVMRASADHSIARRAQANSRAANARVGALAARGAPPSPDPEASASAAHAVDSQLNVQGRLRLESDLAAAAESVRALERELGAARETLAQQEHTISSLRRRLDEQYASNRRLREEHRVELQEMIARYEKRRAAWSPLVAAKQRQRLREEGPGPGRGPEQPERPEQGPAPRRALEPAASCSGDEFAAYLDSFQLQTEKLRARLGLEA